MKRVLCIILTMCFLLCGIEAFAEEKGAYSYTVEYETESETRIKTEKVLSRQETVEYTISRTVPRREGFTFLGWSTKEKDYTNELLYKGGQKVQLTSSVVFYAIWQDNSEKILSYQEGILPSQKAVNGNVRISARIPRKNGYIFCGWRVDGDKGQQLMYPGEEITLKKDTKLVPVWEELKVNKSLELLVKETEDLDILFECAGYGNFDKYCIKVCSMADGEILEYDCLQGSLLVNDFNEGQYGAYILANKNGIEYKSNVVDFVVKHKTPNIQNSLTVYMDGKLLSFDMPPVLLDGHTYVTLRYFCEYVGADVYWDAANAVANITYNGKRIKIKEKSDICVVNGETYHLPAETRIISDRMFIPLRSVAEFMNCSVVWDESQKVYIFTESINEFDHNLFNICDLEGNFLCVKNGILEITKEPDFDGIWIFDTLDAEKNIYRIYSFCELDMVLETKLSQIQEGQPIRLWKESGFDGHVWRLVENADDTFYISPANNLELFVDITEKSVGAEPKKILLKKVYR